jgi:hypothetical protein
MYILRDYVICCITVFAILTIKVTSKFQFIWNVENDILILASLKSDKIAARSHMSTAAIERGVMWVCYPCDIFISVKISLLLCFQNSKVWISALDEDIKSMTFDLKGWLLPLANVRLDINGLMPFTYVHFLGV